MLKARGYFCINQHRNKQCVLHKPWKMCETSQIQAASASPFWKEICCYSFCPQLLPWNLSSYDAPFLSNFCNTRISTFYSNLRSGRCGNVVVGNWHLNQLKNIYRPQSWTLILMCPNAGGIFRGRERLCLHGGMWGFLKIELFISYPSPLFCFVSAKFRRNV